MGMMATFGYWQLRFDWGWPAPIALIVVLGTVPLWRLFDERQSPAALPNTETPREVDATH